ncbi:MAG: hypothetical protein ACI9HK_002963, partial [Pirellulaceae bacterium]
MVRRRLRNSEGGAARRRNQRRIVLEKLEDRQLLTVFSFFMGPNLSANATLSAAVDEVGQRLGGLFSDTDSNGDPLNIKVDIELSAVGANLSVVNPSVITDMSFDAVRNLLVLDA